MRRNYVTNYHLHLGSQTVDDNKRIAVEKHIRAVKNTVPGLKDSPVFICKESNYPCPQITQAAVNTGSGQLRKRKEDVFGAWTTAQNKYANYYNSVRSIMVDGQVRFHEQWATANELRSREETLDTTRDHIGRQRIYQTNSGMLTISGKLSESGVRVPGQQDDLYIAFSFALYWAFAFERSHSKRELYPNFEAYVGPHTKSTQHRVDSRRLIAAY